MDLVDSRSEDDLGVRSWGHEYFAPERVGRFPLLVLSVWCGLVSGFLEVGTVILRKRTVDPNQLYEMSRHFVWLIPLANLCLFVASGVILKLLLLAWPRRVNWLAPRLICSLTLIPILLVGLPRIHGLAWFVVTLGVATRLVPTLERHAALCRRLLRFSFPVVAGLVPIWAATVWGGDWIKEQPPKDQAAPIAGLSQCAPDRIGHRRG